MNREEIQKLLGGYATGTLTPEEQRLLYDAALEDQELFDALAREETLRDVLSDPAVRAQLLAVIEEAPAPWYRRLGILSSHPVPIAALAAIVLVVGATLWQSTRPPELRQLAKVERPPAPQPSARNAPLLPPPPEVRQSIPPSLRKPLAVATPAAAPPPPPPEAFTARDSISLPRMQQAQQDQGQLAAGGIGGNALFGQNHVLQGVVTDPTGQGIRGATVEARYTGNVMTTQTGDRGEFTMAAIPGATYQINATAPGFQPANATATAPVNGEPPPLNLRMNVGAAAETVTVTASAASLKEEAPRTLHGVVTDANGAAIPGADVTVTSVNGDVVHKTTNERGEYTADAAPGTVYRISASKPGFLTASAAVTAPAQPANLRLNAATVPPAPSARAGMLGGVAGSAMGRAAAPMEMKKVAAPAPIEYHLLEKGKTGEVAAGGSVAAGAQLTLRITPGANGHLRVVDNNGSTIVDTNRAQRGKSVDCKLPVYKTPGPMELRIYFSPQGVSAAPSATLQFTVR